MEEKVNKRKKNKRYKKKEKSSALTTDLIRFF